MSYSYSYGGSSDLTSLIYLLLSNAVFMVFFVAIMAVTLVGWWRMFQKAGYEGWKALIPFYNSYIMFEMGFGSGWMFLLTFIPCVGGIMTIILQFKLAAAFGKGIGYGFGLMFFPTIFSLILGFGDAEYYGPNN